MKLFVNSFSNQNKKTKRLYNLFFNSIMKNNMTDDLKQKDEVAAGQDKSAHQAEIKAADAHNAAAEEHKDQADKQAAKSNS
ncbi:MAG: hypothetical protein WC768_00185 [Patescibacteria group bacterium]|jgi:hypothetical protein